MDCRGIFDRFSFARGLVQDFSDEVGSGFVGLFQYMGVGVERYRGLGVSHAFADAYNVLSVADEQ